MPSKAGCECGVTHGHIRGHTLPHWGLSRVMGSHLAQYSVMGSHTAHLGLCGSFGAGAAAAPPAGAGPVQRPGRGPAGPREPQPSLLPAGKSQPGARGEAVGAPPALPSTCSTLPKRIRPVPLRSPGWNTRIPALNVLPLPTGSQKILKLQGRIKAQGRVQLRGTQKRPFEIKIYHFITPPLSLFLSELLLLLPLRPRRNQEAPGSKNR